MLMVLFVPLAIKGFGGGIIKVGGRGDQRELRE
jgi:hypothetical protein